MTDIHAAQTRLVSIRRMSRKVVRRRLIRAVEWALAIPLGVLVFWHIPGVQGLIDLLCLLAFTVSIGGY